MKQPNEFHTSEWLTIPNIISVARLSLVPVYLVEMSRGHFLNGMVIFTFAMGTDWVDGILARRLKQKTRLGSILDPLADKLMVLSAVVVLVWHQWLPIWLCLLLAFRELMMLWGAWQVNKRQLGMTARPTRIGKYATLAMTASVFLASWELAFSRLDSLDWFMSLCFVAGMCVVISAIQYGFLFVRLLGASVKP